ncbi:hypothetical protein JCM8202_001846 [Rhodotorula sphaerocarpa]
MADGRYSWVNMSTERALHLVDADDEDDLDDWDLPDDHILVPAHLLPPYQDEDDDALPSQAHPSYPYGNPYKNHAFAPTSSGSTTARTRPSSSAHHLSPFAHPLTHSASLATTLPALELRHLFERTTFGDPLDRQWPELNLASMFGPKTRVELEEDRKSRDALYNTHGDAGAPAGQNAAAGGGEPDPDDGEVGQGGGGGANGRGAARTQEEVREVAAGEPMQDDGQ